MTKRMRTLGVQFYNTETGAMYKVEHGLVYQLISEHGWVWLPSMSEDELVASDAVIYINGGRNLAIVLAVSMCVVLGFAIWGGL